MIRLALLLTFAALPAAADLRDVVEDHALPRTAAFADAAGALAETARDDCTAAALESGYDATFDAWLGVQHLRLGPVETDGRGLAIAFWPDTRGMVGATVPRLLATEGLPFDDAQAFGDLSVAGRGLFALERLLYDPEIAEYAAGDPACAYARAIAVDLARMAEAIDAEWREGFGETLTSAGAEGNTTYLSETEALQAVYTALQTGLEFDVTQRIGVPLGTFDAPRPERAEARRSGRSLRNVVLSLRAMHDLARALAPGPIPETDAAAAEALRTAEGLDPAFATVGDPQGRLETEILGQKLQAVEVAVSNEIGAPLGISTGFNASDGD